MDVLKDKYYLETATTTRYQNVPVYYNSLFEHYVYGTGAYLSKKTEYQIYTVVEGDTWESIALTFYDNPCYYWVLCNFNRVADPFMQPKAGIQIAVPSLSDLEFQVY